MTDKIHDESLPDPLDNYAVPEYSPDKDVAPDHYNPEADEERNDSMELTDPETEELLEYLSDSDHS